MSRRAEAFTLLEVLIAMSILAIGATSILSVFVAAVSFHTKRVEDNRITQLLNHTKNHAQVAFNAFDPSGAKEDESQRPKKIVADLSDPSAENSRDFMIQEAARKFPGFRYEITFDSNDLAVSGSSVVATIRIYRLSGRRDDSIAFDKIFLTRSGTPVHEFFKSPSVERRDVGRREK